VPHPGLNVFAVVILHGEVICIIPIFVVIFGQKLGIWPPVVPIHGATPTVMTFILKKYHHTYPECIFMVTLHYQMVKIGKFFG
jgi:hypothetical protein